MQPRHRNALRCSTQGLRLSTVIAIFQIRGEWKPRTLGKNHFEFMESRGERLRVLGRCHKIGNWSPRYSRLKKNFQALDCFGFDTIDKIFLYWEKPFWTPDILGFQILWPEYDAEFFKVILTDTRLEASWLSVGEIGINPLPENSLSGSRPVSPRHLWL